jgi:broad specificity phosphatase PhoE
MRPVILIRHGQSTFNAEFEATGVDPMIFDAPLSALGLEQLKRARVQLTSLSKPDIILSSPLTRALQTAVGLFGDRDIPITVSALHREQLECSCDVGRSPNALAAEFPHLRFDHLEDPWWYDGDKDENGISVEPLGDFFERVSRFASWVQSQRGKTVVVVGHGSFFRRLTGHEFENCEILSWQAPDRDRPGSTAST